MYGVPLEAIPSIVQLVPTGALAVYNPPAVIVPHFAIHFTGALDVNCCVFPCTVRAETGVIVIGDTMFTLAVDAPLPFVAVAVTIQPVLG